MQIDEFLGRLQVVRRSGRGWSARCAAHADREPSLSIREAEDGRILLYCFAGCSVSAICGALDLSVADLFPADSRHPRKSNKTGQKPWWFAWERTATDFRFHADGLWLRSKSVLEAAQKLDVKEWTDEDFDVAVNAVAKAYADLEWSDVLEGVAFKLRVRGLNKERQRSEARSTAA